MKFGTFALYKGIELEITRIDNGQFKLISRGNSMKEFGFKSSGFDGVYTKIVCRDEIETAYSVSTRAIFKGYEFEVLEETDDKILITTSNTATSEEMGMDIFDRWDYRRWIAKSEVDRIWEQKKGIYDFTL